MSKQKLFRSELKNIVKECLLEILTEGLGGNQSLVSERKQPQRKRKENKNQLKTSHYLDNISYGTKKQKPIEQKTYSEDPVMNEIFADTAATTLQEQFSADRKKNTTVVGSDYASQVVNQSNPEDLFENADKWASLAFS
jgi:hypothetical protein